MSDFSIHTQILRDQMVEALTDNPEQLAYVLAEIACRMPSDSSAFEELIDGTDSLPEPEQRHALAEFCDRLGAAL